MCRPLNSDLYLNTNPSLSGSPFRWLCATLFQKLFERSFGSLFVLKSPWLWDLSCPAPCRPILPRGRPLPLILHTRPAPQPTDTASVKPDSRDAETTFLLNAVGVVGALLPAPPNRLRGGLLPAPARIPLYSLFPAPLASHLATTALFTARNPRVYIPLEGHFPYFPFSLRCRPGLCSVRTRPNRDSSTERKAFPPSGRPVAVIRRISADASSGSLRK